MNMDMDFGLYAGLVAQIKFALVWSIGGSIMLFWMWRFRA